MRVFISQPRAGGASDAAVSSEGWCRLHAVSIADISINNSMRWSERESVCMLSMTNNGRSNKVRCEMRMGECICGPESVARESERMKGVG